MDKPYDDIGVEHSARDGVMKDVQTNDLYFEVSNQQSGVKIIEGELNDDSGAVWTEEIKISHSDTLAWYSEDDRERYFLKPVNGMFWRINFSRVEDKGDMNWTWVPQIIWDPSSKRYKGKIAMNLPDAWGYFYIITIL